MAAVCSAGGAWPPDTCACGRSVWTSRRASVLRREGGFGVEWRDQFQFSLGFDPHALIRTFASPSRSSCDRGAGCSLCCPQDPQGAGKQQQPQHGAVLPCSRSPRRHRWEFGSYFSCGPDGETSCARRCSALVTLPTLKSSLKYKVTASHCASPYTNFLPREHVNRSPL